MFNLKDKFKNFLIIGLAGILIFGCFHFVLGAWTEPSGSPPSNNIAPPLYKGGGAQTGPLNLKDMTVGSGKGIMEANKFCLCDEITGNCPDPATDCVTSWSSVGGYWTKDAATQEIFYNTANVGIGTLDPAEKLEVRDDTGNTARLRITDDAQNPELQLQYNSSVADDHWAIFADKDNSYSFNIWGGGNNRLSINQNGDIGLGVDNAGRKLDVNGDISTKNNLLTQIDGGLYYGRVGVKENQWDLSNYGNIWVQKDTQNRNWISVAMSSDGKFQTALTAAASQLYISSDYGDTWSPKGILTSWNDVAMSADGKIQTAVVWGGQIYVSIDYGNNWVGKGFPTSWTDVAMSSDGKIQAAVVVGGKIYESRDYGNNWSERNPAGNTTWEAIAMSSDGKIQTALISFGDIYISNDYGDTWVLKPPPVVNPNWKSLSLSSDGKFQLALINLKGIYLSSDYGNTWASKVMAGLNWIAGAMSANGKIQLAFVNGSRPYVSTDYGNNWIQKDAPNNRNWIAGAMSSDGKIQTGIVQNGRIFVSTADSSINGNVAIKNNATISGNLGVGTNNPSSKLNLNLGSFTNTNSATAGVLLEGNAGNNTGFLGYRLTLNNSTANYAGFVRAARTTVAPTYIGLEIGSETSHGIRFLTSGTADDKERMRIDKDGNVGIGTNGPTEKLEVVGNVKATQFIGDGSVLTGIAGLPAGAAGQTLYYDGPLSLWKASSNLFHNGINVGVGTDAPAEKLEVRDDTGNTAKLRITDNAQNPELQLQYNSAVADDHWAIFADKGNSYSFNIWSNNGGGGAEGKRLTIMQDGKVGIGTTGPTALLHLDKTSGDTSVIFDTSQNSETTKNTLQFLKTQSSVAASTAYTQAEISGTQYAWNTDTSAKQNIDVAKMKIGTLTDSIGRLANNYIAFEIGANSSGALAETMRIGSGKVGIGTATPGEKLDVEGGVYWAGNDALLVNDQGGSIELGGHNNINGAGTPYIDFHFNGISEDYNVRLINDVSDTLRLAGGNLVSEGNITVGAGKDVCIAGGGKCLSTAGGGLPAGAAGQTLYYDGPLSLWKASSNLFHNGSKIGIGTASPRSKFAVFGTATNPDLLDTGAIASIYSDKNVTFDFGTIPAIPWTGWLQVKDTGGTWSYPLALQPVGGKVGVGIINPGSRLHIYEDTPDTGDKVGLTVEQKGGGDAIIQYLLTGVQRWTTGVDNSDTDKFKIGRGINWGSGVDLTIDTTGQVGIGTTNPDNKLTVEGGKLAIRTTADDITNNYDFYLQSDFGVADARSGITINSQRGLNFIIDSLNEGGTDYAFRWIAKSGNVFDATKEIMRLSKNGDLGLRTLSPTTNLQIRQSADAPSVDSTANVGLSIMAVSDESELQLFGTSNKWVIASTYASSGSDRDIEFHTTRATIPDLTIAKAHKVGVGTDAPAEKLEVRDDTGNTARLRITDSAQNPELQLQYNSAVADDHWAIFADKGNSYSLNIWSNNGGGGAEGKRFTIMQDGKVGIGTDSPANLLSVEANDANSAIYAKQIGTGNAGKFSGNVKVENNYLAIQTRDALTDGDKLNGVEGIYVQGNYAYVVVEAENRLSIYNISNPNNIFLVKTLQDNVNLDGASDIFVQGGFAYVVCYNSDRLSIFAISNSAGSITFKDTITNINLDGANSVYVQGDYAYVASIGADSLSIYDVSDPRNIVAKDTFTDAVGFNELDGASGVYVQGNYAYVVSKNANSLSIYNISDPTNISEIAGGTITNGNLDGAYSVYVQGNYAYVASVRADNLSIYDISKVSNILAKGTITSAQLNLASSVYVQGNYAYVASFSSFLVFDISNPDIIVLKDDISNANLNNGSNRVFAQGNYAYVISHNKDSLSVFEIETNGKVEVADNFNVNGNTDIKGDINAPNLKRNDCFWTNYINNYDNEFYFVCPESYFMAGESSIHDNDHEDRKFKFYCCKL